MNKENRIALINGIALFAMFFGSGNLIFPLILGSTAGVHLIPVWLAFLLTGVGLPFLGVLTMTLFHGDYWKFFQPLSKPIAFLLITFLMAILCPLFAGPRTETVTYESFQALFAHVNLPHSVFSAIYFALVFLIVLKQSHFTQILGKLLGPIKIILFVILIATALWFGHETPNNKPALFSQISNALTTGYNTMDLLAALFFSGVIYQAIISRCHKEKINFEERALRMTLKSCVIGGALLALIYTGFMFSAWRYASSLQGVSEASIMSVLSLHVFGPGGAWFVVICIALTCIATASALAEVFSHYLYKIIFRHRIPRLLCLLPTVLSMYGMSLLGFDEIIALASPILNILYPCFIVYCLIQLFCRIKFKNKDLKNSPRAA